MNEQQQTDEQGKSDKSALLCVSCGDLAVAKLQMTTHHCEPMLMCDNCLAENEWKANEVNQHEMANFGGAYGLVTYEVLPL